MPISQTAIEEEPLYAPHKVLWAAYEGGWTLVGPVYPKDAEGEWDPEAGDTIAMTLLDAEDIDGEAAWITEDGYVSQDEHQPPPGSWWAMRRLRDGQEGATEATGTAPTGSAPPDRQAEGTPPTFGDDSAPSCTPPATPG